MTIYRRHKEDCPHFDKGRSYNKCRFTVWVDGFLAGNEVRKSVKTRDWTKANQIVKGWEAEKRITEQGHAVTLAEAWTSIQTDFVARNLSPETISKYKLLQKQMTAFAVDRGLSLLSQFNLDVLSQFRATWKDGPMSAGRKIERLRSFFRFALKRKWVESNEAEDLKPPKFHGTPTMPLTSDELKKIYTACDALIKKSRGAKFPCKRQQEKLNALRVKSLILVVRYTGLRISDAISLTTAQLDGNAIVMRLAKTRVNVRVPIPEFVAQALAMCPKQTETRFFWAGNGTRAHAAAYWRDCIKEAFTLAGVAKGEANAMTHRLRDTFAVELLQADVPIERVSKLLGHSSVAITEKHYSPWNRARQLQAEQDVMRSWERDPALNPKKAATKKVQKIVAFRK